MPQRVMRISQQSQRMSESRFLRTGLNRPHERLQNCQANLLPGNEEGVYGSREQDVNSRQRSGIVTDGTDRQIARA